MIKNCYGIRNNVWKFQVSMMKIVPVSCIWSSCIIRIMKTQCFKLKKGITSDNKLMNICEIGLFHLVWGVSKGTLHNYHEIWGVPKRHTWSTVHFLFIIENNWKSTQAWPILKSNSTSFGFFFSRMNNKNFRKRGPHSYFFTKWV